MDKSNLESFKLIYYDSEVEVVGPNPRQITAKQRSEIINIAIFVAKEKGFTREWLEFEKNKDLYKFLIEQLTRFFAHIKKSVSISSSYIKKEWLNALNQIFAGASKNVIFNKGEEAPSPMSPSKDVTENLENSFTEDEKSDTIDSVEDHTESYEMSEEEKQRYIDSNIISLEALEELGMSLEDARHFLGEDLKYE